MRLRAELRDTDLAARFGGDEFAVLLHGIDPKGVSPLVARMQASLAESIQVSGDELVLSLISPLRPAVMRSPDDDFTYLIMPIRLAG